MDANRRMAHGDDSLAGLARATLDRRHTCAAVAAVSQGRIRTASWGAGPGADYEIGSISKGVTGLLLAEAMARGEVGGRTTLGQCLPISQVALASVTLASLATHRSGLWVLPRGRSLLGTTLEVWRTGSNPYAGTLTDLLDQVRHETPRSPRPSYSNLGYQLLGHALAARAGATFADLVAERITKPLGMTGTYVPYQDDDLRPGALRGRSARGAARPPWLGEALAPAGGVRSTIGDMAAFAAALLHRRAAGTRALDPVARFSGRTRIGAAWLTTRVRDREVTWHNGGTAGFRTWLGMDRPAGTAAVVLSATFRPVDGAGFSLLRTITEQEPTTGE